MLNPEPVDLCHVFYFIFLSLLVNLSSLWAFLLLHWFSRFVGSRAEPVNGRATGPRQQKGSFALPDDSAAAGDMMKRVTWRWTWWHFLTIVVTLEKNDGPSRKNGRPLAQRTRRGQQGMGVGPKILPSKRCERKKRCYRRRRTPNCEWCPIRDNGCVVAVNKGSAVRVRAIHLKIWQGRKFPYFPFLKTCPTFVERHLNFDEKSTNSVNVSWNHLKYPSETEEKIVRTEIGWMQTIRAKSTRKQKKYDPAANLPWQFLLVLPC